MNIDPEDFARVDRVYIADWWYTVLPGTFRGIEGGYSFEFRPANRTFTSERRSMHTKAAQIESVQFRGEGA